MDPCRIIDVKKTILEDNDTDAAKLREELKARKLFYLNVMSSPGSGKTSTILRTLSRLKDEFRIGVMEADIDSAVDAETVLATGTPCIQLHTGGMCHLDADMSRQGFRELGIDDLDLVILENVGNLVCPAEFDSGACKNVVILSVPEGDDKPLKYPLMFELCDVVLINKIDAISAFDFDLEKVTEYVHQRKQDALVIPISARTGEGIDVWCDWLIQEVNNWSS